MSRFMSLWRLSKRTGHSPKAGSGASCARMTLLFSCAALTLGGCSAAAPQAESGLISALVSQPAPRPVWPTVDLEDDGREAQRPPRMRMYQREDDPTQPFSPNYGEVPLPQQPGLAEDTPAEPA